MDFDSKTLILNAQQIDKKIRRMAWEIYENNHSESDVVIAGIFPQGAILSQRLSSILKEISSLNIELIEVRLDKDEPLSSPIEVNQHENFNSKVVILVDDVLKSGKTLMYSTQYFLNQPIKKLMTAVLVDRNYRLYPIKADVVGLSLSTTFQEHVSVEFDDENAVYLI
ncbi:MAG: phosphoribosyltransferase family protein [Flavobacteriales bacterium]